MRIEIHLVNEIGLGTGNSIAFSSKKRGITLLFLCGGVKKLLRSRNRYVYVNNFFPILPVGALEVILW